MIVESEALLTFVAGIFSFVVVLALILVGVRNQPEGKSYAEALRRLSRSRIGGQVGGVCAGLGKHTAIPTWLWRFVFLVLLFFLGSGVLIYLILWISLPKERTGGETS